MPTPGAEVLRSFDREFRRTRRRLVLVVVFDWLAQQQISEIRGIWRRLDELDTVSALAPTSDKILSPAVATNADLVHLCVSLPPIARRARLMTCEPKPRLAGN